MRVRHDRFLTGEDCTAVQLFVVGLDALEEVVVLLDVTEVSAPPEIGARIRFSDLR
jgi:hypothetical protein